MAKCGLYLKRFARWYSGEGTCQDSSSEPASEMVVTEETGEGVGSPASERCSSSKAEGVLGTEGIEDAAELDAASPSPILHPMMLCQGSISIDFPNNCPNKYADSSAEDTKWTTLFPTYTDPFFFASPHTNFAYCITSGYVNGNCSFMVLEQFKKAMFEAVNLRVPWVLWNRSRMTWYMQECAGRMRRASTRCSPPFSTELLVKDGRSAFGIGGGSCGDGGTGAVYAVEGRDLRLAPSGGAGRCRLLSPLPPRRTGAVRGRAPLHRCLQQFLCTILFYFFAVFTFAPSFS